LDHGQEEEMDHRSYLLAMGVALGACSGPLPVQRPPVTAPPRPPSSVLVFPPGPPSTAAATIRDLVAGRVGDATFTDTHSGLLVAGMVTGLGLGAHAIHIHETGRCVAPFATAGAHFNPQNRRHGFQNRDGPHLGDLPNIDMPAAGILKFEFVLPGVSLKGTNALLDADGASIVIHTSRDDYVTDPAGGSGARLACGVIVAR
jgi:Cu-Zn family superoxide dismutase